MSKDKKDLFERVRAVEVQVEGLTDRMDRFEQYCRDTQDIYRESLGDLNARIESFLKNEIHDLEARIEEAKNAKREPLSTWDWTKIIVTVVTVVGTIIVALVQYGII